MLESRTFLKEQWRYVKKKSYILGAQATIPARK
jgi:hypothetical protein